MAVQLDFSNARKLIARALDVMDEIEGFTADSPDTMTGPGRRNDPQLAKVTRQVVEVTDMLAGASAEARIQFHVLKGSGDPRQD